MRVKTFLACILLVLAIGSAAQAQLWTGGGANANWTTVLNWSPGAPVNNGTANLTFGGSTQLANNVDVAYSINSLTFNTTAGAFSIGGSTLTIGAGGITNSDASLQTITAPINVNVAQTWSTVGNLTTSGILNGAGNLTKDGAGILTLSGVSPNGFSGTLNVNTGTVILAKTGGARAISGTLIIGDGSGGPNADVVRYANHQQILSSATISMGGSGLLDLNGFNQDITNLSLNGSNITTGSGTLSLIGSGLSTAAAAGITATISGRLDLANGVRTFAIGDNSSLATDADISAAITSSTASLGALIKSNPGTLRLSGATANTYSGTTSVIAGTLALAKSIPDAAIAGDLTIGNFDLIDTVRLDASNQIANTSDINFNPGGRLDMNGNNEAVNALFFNGGSGEVIGAGTLTINSDVLASAGTSSNNIFPGLNLGGENRIFTIADGAAVADFAIYGNISNGTLEKQGPGELQLNGNNTAQISLGAGKLTLANNNALGTLPAFFGDGTVSALGDHTIASGFFLVGNTTVDGSFALTFMGNFSGIGNLTKNGTGTLSFTAANTIQGDWTLNSGTLNGTDLSVGTLGTFTINGGTFSGSLDNHALLTFNNGTFDGNLINDGTLVINNVIGLATHGMTNNTNITLATGQTLSVFSPGLQNNGQITLFNSTLNLSSSANNGIITGYGTITGSSGFTNNGLISQDGGNIILSNFTSQRNNGNIDLAPGRQLVLQSSSLDNRGTINLNGGIIAGASALQNNLGGSIVGRGAILSPFANNAGGTLRVQDGTVNIPSPFANSGTIAMAASGSLVGGAVNNSGTIQGNGSIANDISNGGTIEAIGGTLALGGVISNNGTLAASTGNKLLFSNGLPTNNNLINLTGGTFDNNSFAIANLGQISGFGIFRSGGLTNNGSITFTGGFTTINGNVTNAAAHQIKIAYDPALFTGNVINNGIFKNTSSTITFSGAYTENGTFISDPADNFFNSVSIGPSGTWVGGLGDRFFVSGDFHNQSTSAQWNTNDAELHLLAGSGDLLEVNGRDLGVSFDGYDSNYAWGKLTLAAGRTLILTDADTTPGGAIYIGHLELEGGISQIASITGNGLTLYYHLGNPDNAYLQGKSYSLAGGGSIMPVPEPATALSSAIALALLATRPRRDRRNKYGVLRTPRRRV